MHLAKWEDNKDSKIQQIYILILIFAEFEWVFYVWINVIRAAMCWDSSHTV